MNKKQIIADYLSERGKLGGDKRRENSTPEQRRAWGKKGGRPSKVHKKLEAILPS